MNGPLSVQLESDRPMGLHFPASPSVIPSRTGRAHIRAAPVVTEVTPSSGPNQRLNMNQGRLKGLRPRKARMRTFRLLIAEALIETGEALHKAGKRLLPRYEVKR